MNFKIQNRMIIVHNYIELYWKVYNCIQFLDFSALEVYLCDIIKNLRDYLENLTGCQLRIESKYMLEK